MVHIKKKSLKKLINDIKINKTWPLSLISLQVVGKRNKVHKLMTLTS